MPTGWKQTVMAVCGSFRSCRRDDFRASIDEHFARFITDADARAVATATGKVLQGLGESAPTRSRHADWE